MICLKKENFFFILRQNKNANTVNLCQKIERERENKKRNEMKKNKMN